MKQYETAYVMMDAVFNPAIGDLSSPYINDQKLSVLRPRMPVLIHPHSSWIKSFKNTASHYPEGTRAAIENPKVLIVAAPHLLNSRSSENLQRYRKRVQSSRMPRMLKRHYVMALGCYLTIPAVVIAGVGFSRLIDPELARGSADYERNFRLLELAATGALMVTTGLALLLGVATCYLVLKSRQRSVLWLALASTGPFGLMSIAMLADRSPAPEDLYQQITRKLKLYWRILLEIAVFVTAWMLAYQCVVLKRELLIRFESFSTGTPVGTIVARQNASSGMYAFGEGLETIYLVPLLYLLWPIFFNLVGRRFTR